MACTRAKNTSGNYCLEQRGIQHIMNYGLYENSASGQAVRPALPDIGIILHICQILYYQKILLILNRIIWNRLM